MSAAMRRVPKQERQAVSVLSAAELERLRTKTTEKPLEVTAAAITVSQVVPDELVVRGLADVSRWPPVQDATSELQKDALQRQRRLEERERRLAAEEAQRVQLDKMEAENRAQQRAEQIERASRLLYRDTDKVKTFHSSLLLSDVLAEREQQIAIRKEREELERRKEAEFIARRDEELVLAEQVERYQKQLLKQKAQEQKQIQTQQLEALRQQLLRERDEDRREGMLIKQAAVEEAILNAEKAQAAKSRALAATLATTRANEQLQLFKEAERLREQEEDKKIEEYVQKKDAKAAERAQKEAERAADRNARRDRTIAMLETQLLQARQASDNRLKTAEEEARIAADNREAEARERRRREYQAIELSRQQQFAIRREEKERLRQEEEAMVRGLQIRNAREDMMEQAQKRAVRERNEQLARHHLAAAARKEARSEAEKLRDMEADLHMRLALEEDDEMFQQYVEQRTAEWRAEGRDTKPIEIATKKIAKAGMKLTPAI